MELKCLAECLVESTDVVRRLAAQKEKESTDE